LFVEFVLGQDRWGVGGGVHHGHDSFFGGEVNAAGGGDGRGPIIIGGIDSFVLINGFAGFSVIDRNEAARFDRENAAFVVKRGIAVGKAADATPGDDRAAAGANGAESAPGFGRLDPGELIQIEVEIPAAGTPSGSGPSPWPSFILKTAVESKAPPSDPN
jgi:hypothetical protein